MWTSAKVAGLAKRERGATHRARARPAAERLEGWERPAVGVWIMAVTWGRRREAFRMR